jgi:hypothetical protein
MSLFVILSIAFAAVFAVPAGAQQCADGVLVGSASGKDRGAAFKAADQAWRKEATAKLTAKDVFHVDLKTKCGAAKGKGEYTCTVSAKACDKPGPRTGPLARSSCHPSGACEVCCIGFNGRPSCMPVCE